MEAAASPDWSSDDATSHERRQERRSYRISTMGAPPARSFDEPRSGREDRRRAVLGDEAAGIDLRRGLRRLEVAGTGRRSEGSALRPQLEPPNARMRFGSPMVRALFRTAEQEIGPQRRPSGTSIDLSDIEQSQLEEERQDRKNKKKKKKSKKKRKKSNDKKRGKEKEKETTTDEHDDEASLVKRTSTGAATTTKKKKKPSIDGRRRKSYIFPIDEAAHLLQEPAVPLHVWFYQTVLNFLWPPLNYYRLHFLYICCCSVFGGLLIYLSQGPGNMSYTDALFLSTSAVTTCGLVTTDTARVNRLGQFWVVVLMIVGNFVLLTLPPVFLRLYYFRKHFRTTGLRCKRRVGRLTPGVGTAEYSALKWFAAIVPLYYFAWVGISSFIISFYFSVSSSARDVLRQYGNNPVWWAIFHSVSSFSNAGISTTPNNMVAFQDYPFPLFVSSLLILAGYTAFPLLMRFIVWCLYRHNKLIDYRPVFKYMLDHPRRCFTHLFPAAETRWLLLVFIFLNSVEFLSEIILDWYSEAYHGFTPGLKLANMYYQTISIRVAGFNSIDVNKLNTALLWLYTGMMYISATPVAIAVRYTGAARAQEIGIKRGIPMNNTLAAQAQNIFVKHTIVLFVAVLFIIMIEELPLTSDPNFSIFKIIFEIVSAYGPVGLSLGYGDKPYSFSGAFRDGSKLIIIFIMILGKHRGLPDSIDSAISLPSTMQPRDLERGDAPRTSAERRRRQRYESDDDDHDRNDKRRDDDRAGGDSSDDDDDGGPTKRVKRVAWALWDSLLGHDDGHHRPNANANSDDDDEDPGLSAAPTYGHKTLERQDFGKAAATGVSDLKSADSASTEEWRDLLQPLEMTKDHPMHGRHRRSYDTLPLPAPTTEPERQQQEQQTSPGHHHHDFDDKHNSGIHDSSLVADDDGGGHHLLVQHYHHPHHRNLSLPAVFQRPIA
ncbi:cation transport domain containing protein [Acanthamoeba castellanii str. Neff]|uniref:Cation transport domain containing protein n=1 Tax=Acanthamoeba castellanii (strain ATCC 30010 / Neff) TaxID=1257118 RepID=L8HGY1_ACACF|nr:cation transport domain containing protein [Acanthamoeba castellanii str. Neff]ELR24824.1 cation transport domain containing protein [Acanthamoeba castellanii str. Neff]